MKVSFFLYSRVALGRQLAAIVEACRTTRLLAPQRLLLTSRERRDDLGFNAVVASAASSASDSCEIRLGCGEIGLAWVYGGRNHVPRLWGSLTVSNADVAELTVALDRLAVVSGTTYGLADLASVRQAAMRRAPDLHGSGDALFALQSLHWYNYFGREIGQALARGPAVSEAVTEIRDVERDAFRVLLGQKPEASLDAGRVRVIAAQWPCFREYDTRASFEPPIRIDYSQAWGLPAPDTRALSLRELVGPADEFIAIAPRHAAKFNEWARSAPAAVETEDDFRRVFRQHEALIRDELLVPAIAAYGEMVRRQIGGIWQKSRFLHRGEPVVGRPGRPWSQRRVLLEVLEALAASDPDS